MISEKQNNRMVKPLTIMLKCKQDKFAQDYITDWISFSSERVRKQKMGLGFTKSLLFQFTQNLIQKCITCSNSFYFEQTTKILYADSKGYKGMSFFLSFLK